MVLCRFWSEYFWLPVNITWADIRNGEGKVVYAEPKDFWVQIPLVVFVLTMRFISDRYIFKPLGRYLKISDYKRKSPPNAELEVVYRQQRHFPLVENVFDRQSLTNHGKSINLKQLLSSRKNARWWRLRTNQDKPTTLHKFSENMWLGSHYLLNTLFGIYVTWNQPWAWDGELYFDGYPHQGITPDLRWYYMVVTSFYISLTITHFRDVRRKDFYPMFVHHITVVAISFLGWCSQCFRIGCVLLTLSDMVEIILEFGKAAKYAKCGRLVDCLFVLFVCGWVGTRLVLLPAFVLPRALHQWSTSPVILVMNMMLAVVFSLTVMWSWLILQVLITAVKDGQVKKDVRSSQSEDSDGSISDDVPQKRKNRNFHNASRLRTSRP